MVRVLTCHHFAYQEVFTTDNEPEQLYAADDKVFVATSQCFIEVHSLKEHGCPLIAKFPTVAPVKQIVFSSHYNFIATLEEKPSKFGSQGFVRVYLNWLADLTLHPMRARLAGQMTSIRHNTGAESPRFEVIEIPLKGHPTCISADCRIGTLAVGIGSTALIYGFCSKEVAGSKERHRDMKCLLELTFSFDIKQISVCEEYISCASDRDFQVIRVKGYKSLDGCPFNKENGDVKMRKNASDVSLPDLGAEVSAKEPLMRLKSRDLSASPSFQSVASAVSRYSTSSRSTIDSHDADSYVVDDENYMHWNFEDEEEDKAYDRKPQGPPRLLSMAFSKSKNRTASATTSTGKTIILKGMKHGARARQGALHAELRRTGEMYGPVAEPMDCPVTVEYEDVCEPCDSKKGYIYNEVTTFIYKKFPPDVSKLHSLQLRPIYKSADRASSAPPTPTGCTPGEAEPCGCDDQGWGKSSSSSYLVTMLCFISSPQEGYLYRVSKKPQLLSAYPYTTESIQVSVSAGMLYAITNSGLEVYTSRALTTAMLEYNQAHNIDMALPPANLEPCLLGLQPFIGPQVIARSKNMVILLSKHVAMTYKVEETNWSIYALKTPSTETLYGDMMELIEQYQHTDIPSTDITHLVKEAHLSIRAHEFKHGYCLSDIMKKYLKESAAMLADVYAKPGNPDWRLAVPYFLTSELSTSDILARSVKVSTAQEKESIQIGRGLFAFLDHVLFAGQENISTLTKTEGDLILYIYKAVNPERLSTVLLKSKLKSYSIDVAMSLLQEWSNNFQKTNQTDKKAESLHRLDILGAAMLHLQQGDQAEAEAAIFSIPKKDLVSTCVRNHQMLHEDYRKLTPLAQLMRRHKPNVFLRIITGLLDTSVISLESAMKLLHGTSSDVAHLHGNSHVTQLLEMVLSDARRHLLFNEAAPFLVDTYLTQLEDWRPESAINRHSLSLAEILPKGSGHFGRRSSWLNDLHPFQGVKSLHQPCIYADLTKAEVKEMKTGAAICPCCTCHSTLLKLQSLLCSKFTSGDLYRHLLEKLKIHHDLIGWDSLNVLALAYVNPTDAADDILQKSVHILPEFAVSLASNHQDVWSHAVNILLQEIRQCEKTDKERHQLYTNIFTDVLSRTADSKTPKEFLQLLPEDGSTNFFFPYIEQCYRSNQARVLRDVIIAKAQALGESR